jgi:hypothetical protein
MFGEEAQKEHVFEVAVLKFSQIKEELRKRVDVLTSSGEELDDGQVEALLSSIVKQSLDEVSAKPLAFQMDAAHEASIRELYRPLIDETLELVFEKLPLPAGVVESLRDIVIYWLSKDVFPTGTSGVVVAGFGMSEHFPHLRAATIQARVGGRLKFRYRADKEVNIGIENGAAVVPFAQIDAVQLFVEGIEPKHAKYATKLVAEKLQQLTKDILATLDLSDEDREAAEKKWSELATEHWRDFSNRAKQARVDNYVAPLIDVIGTLPKDELAAVAEALVNITSLRRRVSLDAETVGGPIDVAVITKGDGLIWN